MEIGNRAPGGAQAAAIDAVAIAAAVRMADEAAGVEVVDELVMHAIFEEELHSAQGVLGDIPPQALRVLDLAPEVGYGEIGQCWHTGHGRILL